MAAIFQIRRGTTEASLQEGELYLNQTTGSLQIGSGSTTVTLAKLNQPNIGNFNVTGDVTIGGTITIGDAPADNLVVNADLSSSIIPNDDNAFDLGSISKRYKTIFGTSISGSLSGSIYGINEGVTAFSTSLDLRLDLLEGAMSGSKRLYVSPSGSDSNTGLEPHIPFKTIKAAVESLGSAVYTNTKRYTIFVGSGEYVEQNPIVVPPGVAIVGDNLRTVRLTAANPTKDYFHCHDSNYFYGLRFLDLKHPAFCFAYPSSTATSTISGGSVNTISVVHSMTGYTDGNNQDLGIIIEGPDASGSIATATANVVGGVITQINVVSGGTNYTTNEKPHISIPAPVSKRPVITTSPYIQNCSSITGPFNTSGVKIPITTPLPYDIVALQVDEQGAGGGILIDGNLVHPLSPLESFVADAFTQVNQGGPGHLVINKGYAQFVSCFTTFCTYGFKVVNGGFANISNSVIDFGKKGLVSKTYYPQTYNTAIANQSKYSSVSGFEITQDGAGYTGSIAAVSLTAPNIIGGTQATAEAVVSILGTITSVYITNAGTGYTSEPIVTIAPPTGPGAVQATANSIISGVTEMRMILSSTTQSVEISSNMILDGQNYLVTNVTTGSTISEKLITTFPNPPQIVSGSNVYFHKLSNISTGGLVIEYGGSGVTYNALPKFGGIPDRTKEIVEIAPGRIFYSTVDNIGNLKIGEYFAVDQLTGEVTIDARNFNLSGINQIGPFRRNGLSVGEVLREVSDSVTLVNSQGVIGSDTVPTQYGVHSFVSSVSSSISSSINVLNAKNSTLASVTSSYNTFTASVNGHITNINTKTGSFETKFSTLQTLTGSFETNGRGIISSSAQLSGTTITNLTITNLTTVNQTASVVFSSGSNRFGDAGNDIHSFTGSVQISGSITTIGTSTATTFIGSIGATNGVVSGSSQVISLLPIGTISASAQITALGFISSSQTINTGSFAITGSNSFNGSQQITGSLLVSQNITGSASASFISLAVNTTTPAQKIHLKGIVGIEAGTTGGATADQIVFGYNGSGLTQYTHKIQTGHDAQSALNRMDFLLANSSNTWKTPLQLRPDVVNISASVNVTGSLTSNGLGVLSGSAQITSLGFVSSSVTASSLITASVNVNVITFTKGDASTFSLTIAASGSVTPGTVSGSIQVLGGSTIHSGSTGDYQFNSIGVGTAASAVPGEIRAINDITAFYSSDIRLKENIIPIPSALEKVNQISGNTYDWKDGYEEIHSHKGNDVGVIAQEIEAVLPQIVTNRDNGYKAVQYEKIIPLLIEAIKELSNKIDRLENK